MSQKLYTHQPHAHQPRNINVAAKAERLSFNNRLAVFISKRVGSMACAWLFAVIGIASLVGAVTQNALLALTFGALSSYFLQLVLLPLLALGTNIVGRHSELMAEEQFATTQATYQMLEQLVAHLHAQDAVLLHLRQTQALILDKLGIDLDPTTDGRLPIVRMDKHTLLDEDEMRLSLARWMKPELLANLSPEHLLMLEKLRPHQEARHDLPRMDT